MSDKIFTKEEWNAEVERIAARIEYIDATSKRTKYEVIDKAIHDITANYAELIRMHRKD